MPSQVRLLAAQKPIIEGAGSVDRKDGLFRKAGNLRRRWRSWSRDQLPRLCSAMTTFKGEKEKCWGPALVGSRDSLRMTALAIRIAIA